MKVYYNGLVFCSKDCENKYTWEVILGDRPNPQRNKKGWFDGAIYKIFNDDISISCTSKLCRNSKCGTSISCDIMRTDII